MSTDATVSQGTTRSELRRTISPYDLTAGDNPGILISKPLLRGHNFDEWAMNLRLALKARKKFGFADGSIPQPDEDSPDYEDWVANNALVVSWIKLTIDESLASTLAYTDDAHELWKHIQKRFGVKNGQRVQRLKLELANCRQHGMAIEAYYGKLTKIWRNLSDYQQAKTMEEVRKEREEDKLHQFLMGLDDTVFGAVRSSILSREPLPSLEEAYNILAQDEESRRPSRFSDERIDAASFAVHSAPTGRNDNKSVVCSVCGRTGHLGENCFRKIGYPDWWLEKNKSTSQRGTRSSQQVSASKSKPPAVAHANLVSTVSGSSSSSDAERTGISGLNEKQWKTLITLLNERNPPTERLSGMSFIQSWIIDTGASNHMTGSIDFLDDIIQMPLVLI